MVEEFLMPFENVTITANSRKKSAHNVSVIVDGVEITKKGNGMSAITFEGVANDKPRLFVKGEKSLMLDELRSKLVNIELD